MKKTVRSFFVLLAIPFLGFSQTQVSGNIRGNTVWTKANSPYILSGTVGVPAAYTLIIEPGVTIERSADFQILINGAVTINGSSSDSITFISGATINQDNKPFIEFQKSNLNNSSIRFVRFANLNSNGNNIRLGNESEYSETSPKNSGSLSISRSNLSYGYTATKGYEAASSLNIDSSIISSGFVIGYYPRSEAIKISNTTVSESTINSDSYNYGIFFNNCKVTKTTLKLGCCGSNINFANSIVSNSIMNETSDYGSVNIQNCLFLNTPLVAAGHSLTINSSKYIITNDSIPVSFYYNFPANSSKPFAIMSAAAVFTNSEFIGVNNVGLLYNTKYGTSSKTTLTNNIFKNFKDVVTVLDFASITLSDNNFLDPGRYNIVNYSTKDFSALNNYYELNSGQTIDDVISDGNDDLNYGVVNYTPYSTSPVVTTPILQPNNVTKELSDDGNVIVKWEGSPQARPARAARTGAVGGYKVYWGYVDPFTYAHERTVPAGTYQAVLNGALVTDSIAVTAIDPGATGTNDQLSGKESWYARAAFQASILPVKLISFNAVGLGNKTQVIWETASEVNNDHFEVQYSTDGSTFKTIGTVKGTGSNGSRNSYCFEHNTATEGYKYYRLKQVDKDGELEYSRIVKVKSGAERGVAVYPNPATSTINLVSTVAIVNASIIDGTGQLIKKVNGGNSLQLKINISSLPAGSYRVLVTNQNKEIRSFSFIKQ